jgi:hypothetical protein
VYEAQVDCDKGIFWPCCAHIQCLFVWIIVYISTTTVLRALITYLDGRRANSRRVRTVLRMSFVLIPVVRNSSSDWHCVRANGVENVKMWVEIDKLSLLSDGGRAPEGSDSFQVSL